MTHNDWIRKEVARLKIGLSELEHGMLSRVHTHEEYLVAVGVAKQLGRTISEYEAQLKLQDNEDMEDFDDGLDDEPAAKNKPEPRRRQPRQWGGGN